MKRAILVCVDNDINQANKSLDELANLLETLDIKEVARVVQKAKMPNNKTYVGSGKIDEIKQREIIDKADYIVFDDELSPAQMFNVDEIFEASVIDRAYVILDIFRKRATTLEAKLEIKIANLKYLYPRIKTFHEGFDRQSGRIGSKGSGETQLELDQRMIINQIVDNENKLKDVMKRKKNEVNKRSNTNLKTVALVGYTNAGKSSTLNALLNYLNKHEYKSNTQKKEVEAEDKLFKTLTTSVRKLTYKNIPFLLSDTIGFINKIPPELVASFLTTLEEVKAANLVIIVVDISDANFATQLQTTINTLDKVLGDNNPEILIVFNKIDKFKDAIMPRIELTGAKSIPYSNLDEDSQYRLLEEIYEFLLKDYEILDLRIPYDKQKLVNQIEENTSVISKTYLDTYILYKIYCPKTYVRELSLYRINDLIS